MKFQLDKNGHKLLEAIFETNALSMEASDLLSAFLTDHYADIDDKRMNRFRCELSLSPEQAYYQAMLSVLDIDPEDEELRRIEKAGALCEAKRLKPSTFLENPYLRAIPIRDKRVGKWHLTKNYYAPYEGFLYDQTHADPERNFLSVDGLGYFDEKVDYPLVEEGNHVWMSVTPYEINTMAPAIERACGNVLALGLGLGYFPFMALRKKAVANVTVIEKDPKVVALFKEMILPQFPNKNIRIVLGDAFAYLDKNGSKFDYVFADVHSTPEDGLLPYRRFLSWKKKNPSVKADFWIEDSVLVYFRRILIELMEEESTNEYERAEDAIGLLMDKLHHKLRDLVLQSSEDILKLLDDDSLKKILAETEN